MKIVWERESTTVRDVYETLLERRKVAYTTVMTMMKILEQKKYLKKTLADRAYVYRPAQPKGQVIGDMVRDFIDRVFNGSAEPLLVPAAIDAVKLWVYQRTLLNGEPVEVLTQIDVNFTLSDTPIQQ